MDIEKQIIEEYLERYDILPTTLYHYTSISGLLGVINSKSIWASDIQYLNDKDEFFHTINILEKKAAKSFKGRSQNKLKQQLYSLFKGIGILDEFDVYVFSLSEKGDLLSQWRGYCPNFGFSIAFDLKKLKKAVETNIETECILLPCFYDEKIKKDYVDQLFSSLLVAIAKFAMNEEVDYDKFEKVIFEYFKNLITTASIFKSASFSEEREWRLFLISRKENKNTQPDFRSGSSMIIPYVELNIGTNYSAMPISEIIVSPVPNQDISIKSTIKFLEHHGIKCPVSGSTIPFRKL